MTALRVAVATPERPKPPAFEAASPPRTAPSPDRTRRCVFENTGAVDTPCLARDGLRQDDWKAGPAIIEDQWSTIVVPPGDRFRVDGRGNVLIDVAVQP